MARRKPALRELVAIREAIFRLYRTKGYGRAKDALTRLTDAMAHSPLPEVRTLRTRSCAGAFETIASDFYTPAPEQNSLGTHLQVTRAPP